MPATNIEKSDPLVANHFFLEVDGEVISQLAEVSGLDVELEVTDIQQQLANGQYAQRKAFSKPKWTGEISVKRLVRKHEEIKNRDSTFSGLPEASGKRRFLGMDPFSLCTFHFSLCTGCEVAHPQDIRASLNCRLPTCGAAALWLLYLGRCERFLPIRAKDIRRWLVDEDFTRGLAWERRLGE